MRNFLTLLFVCLSVTLQAQVRMSLERCREMALESSKKIAVAERQVAKMSFDKKAYRSHFFPKISGMGMYAYMQKDYSFKINGGYLPTYTVRNDGTLAPNLLINPVTGQPVIGADGNPVFNQYAYMPDIHLSLGLDNAYTAGAVVEQPIYMGGKVRSAFRMASIGAEMAELNYKYNRSEIILEADEAYWQFVKLNELEVSALKYKEVVSALVKNLSDACETGMASKNDLLKAQVKLNEAELMVQKANNGKALAGMNLCRLTGLDLYTSLQADDTLTDGITAGVLENTDITARPEYGILDKDILLKKARVDLVRSDFLPQLGVSASYSYTDGIALNGKADGVGSFMAMASLKVPVFHWSEGRNKIKSAQAEQEMSELKKEDMVQLMLLEVAKFRFNVENAATRVELTRKSLYQAKENLAESKNRYEVGMETLTNYMEAQAQWQQAWSNWIEAKADLRVSETQYLKATGRLD